VLEGYPVPTQLIPLWTRRAVQRRRLLLLGVSLTEQADMPARDLSEVLAVDDVYLKHQAEEQERANRG